MKTANCTLILAALTVFCATSVAEDDLNEKPKVMASEMNLIGAWEIDAKAFAAAIKQQAGDDGASFEPLLKDFKFQMRFQAKGKMSVDANFAGNEQKKSGDWKIIRLDANTAIISTDVDGEKADEIKVVFIDQNTIDLYPPKEEVENSPFAKMRFTRVKE